MELTPSSDMARSGISVAVIGGGIGGLAAALSLLRAGVDVHVYERVRALSELGAGTQASANCSRILHRLGLAEALARTWLYGYDAGNPPAEPS